MTIREETEQIERQVLSKYASFSDSTMGRDTETESCTVSHLEDLSIRLRFFFLLREIITEQDLLTHWKLRRLQEP